MVCIQKEWINCAFVNIASDIHKSKFIQSQLYCKNFFELQSSSHAFEMNCFALLILATSLLFCDCAIDDKDVPVDPSGKFPKKFRASVVGRTPIDLTNNNNLNIIQNMANTVVTTMNRNWNGLNSWGLLSMVNADVQQITNGQSYLITFNIGQTTCRNNPVSKELVSQRNFIHIYIYILFFFFQLLQCISSFSSIHPQIVQSTERFQVPSVAARQTFSTVPS